MTPTLVLVHGRAQEFKKVEDLIPSWLGGLDAGLRAARMPPADPDRVVMPYYGNILYRVTADNAASRIRLEGPEDQPGPFHPYLPDEVGKVERELLRDQALAAGVPVLRQEGPEALLSWGLARRALESLAKRTRIDQAVIVEFLRDVAVYLTLGREPVLSRVREAIPADGEIVLVTHSLGTVVGRDLLLDDDLRERTTLWVTAGSPLGLDAVRKNLGEQARKNPGLPWLSAYDVNDIVALGHPLRPKWGDPPVADVEVENDADPHSISRYLAHREVAEQIGKRLSGRR